MKKTDVGSLLRWAFTHELGKVGAETAVSGTSWDLVSRMGLYGTMIDRSPNHYGVLSDFVFTGAPHPDALAVGDAVRGLADLGSFDIPEGWNPFPEWIDDHGLIGAEIEQVLGEARLRGDRLDGRHIVAIVTGAAILGKGPDWHADKPSAREVMMRGKPAWFVMRKATDALGRTYEFEDDGYDARRQRPKRGAYRKIELVEPLRGAILARLDWQLWQDALAVLCKSLVGRLEAHDLLPFVADRQPWVRAKMLDDAEQAIDLAS